MSDTVWFYPIDWLATGTFLSGVGAILSAAAIIFAAVKARDTFKEWRKRENFKEYRKIASEALAIMYRAEDILKHIRNESQFYGEEEAAYKYLSIPYRDENKKGYKPQGAICIYRINHYSSYWESVYDILPIVKVNFGDNAYKNMKEIIRVRNIIVSAANICAFSDGENISEKYLVRVSSDFWKSFGMEQDPIQYEYEKIKLSLDQELLKFVRDRELPE